METQASFLFIVGVLLLASLATYVVGSRTALPRVTLLVLLGVLIGPAVLDLLPDLSLDWFPVVANMALVMVSFLLGESMSRRRLRRSGRAVLAISLTTVAATAVVIFVGLTALGTAAPLALLLAGVALATDPAATADVVRESQAEGPYTDTILGVVAIDDAWGLMGFSLLLAGAEAITGGGGSTEIFVLAAREILGALALGVALGVPMAYLTGRIEPGEPTVVEALGAVFLCGGLALRFEVSLLLAAMTMGATVANLATHHTRPFHAIEGVESPFLILFFILAGASLELDRLVAVGATGAAFLLLRIAGRLIGGAAGAPLAGYTLHAGLWLGAALLPQAGVALGMALLAVQRFPQAAGVVMTITVASTVVFELAGPVATRFALRRLGEAPAPPRRSD